MNKARQRSLVLGLCLLAFGLRVIGLAQQSLWRDEVDALRFSLQSLAELLQLFVRPGQNGPLYYLLLRPWLKLAGQNEFALRFPSALLGVLAVPLVYRLVRRLFPRQSMVALVSALLAAVSPYLVWYGQEGKMYAFLVVLVLVSMDFLMSAMQCGGWQRWLGYVVVTSVAFHVHLAAVLIVPVQVVVFCLFDKRVRSARWKPWLASLLVLVIPYLPLLAWQVPMLAEPGETGFAFVSVDAMLRSLIVNYSLGVALPPSLWSVGPFLAALLGTLAAFRWEGIGRRSIGVLLCWLLMPIASLFVISLVRPLFTARYLILVLPAYLVLLAVGVTAVGQRSSWFAGVLLSAVLVVSGWGLVHQVTPIKSDFRGATSYVAREMEAGDLILFQIPYGRHSFEYYMRQRSARQQGDANRVELIAPDAQPPAGLSVADGRYAVLLPWVAGRAGMTYRWADGLYTNHGMTPEQVDQRMQELVNGNGIVWFVATEVPLWDERGLVQAWLDEHGVLDAEAVFVRVSVRCYRMP